MRGRFRAQKRLLFFGAVHLLRVVSFLLPRRWTLCVFARIGDLVRHVDRPAVRRSRAHLQIALGSRTTERERDEIVRRMFRAVGRSVADVLRLSAATPERLGTLVTFEGLEHLDAALARGRGVVALSAHLGNWELLGAALAARGYELHVVARELFDRRSDRFLHRWRTRCGLRVHRAGDSLFPLVRALRAGETVGVLADQDTGAAGIFVPFFGRPAWTPTAGFALAERTGAALVPLWITLQNDGRHLVRVCPALPRSAAASEEERIRFAVERWHGILEGAIRARPEQWVWFHRRWKTLPPAVASGTAVAESPEAHSVRVRATRGVLIAR